MGNTRGSSSDVEGCIQLVVVLAFVWIIIGAIFGGLRADREPRNHLSEERLPNGNRKFYWDDMQGHRGMWVEDAEGNVIYEEDDF